MKSAYLAGEYALALWRHLEARLAALRNQPPYQFRQLPASLFRTALRQYRNSRHVNCRTVDRLHLGAIEELNLVRLMTHDEQQAKAAEAAGFEVVRPLRANI